MIQISWVFDVSNRRFDMVWTYGVYIFFLKHDKKQIMTIDFKKKIDSSKVAYPHIGIRNSPLYQTIQPFRAPHSGESCMLCNLKLV